MDQLLTQFIANMPIAGMLFIFLKQVYEDAKADRKQAQEACDEQTTELKDVKAQLLAINIKLDTYAGIVIKPKI